jgi:hypothetical protein
MSRNSAVLEELLFNVQFFAHDSTRDAVLASYLVEALSDEIVAIDDLTPVLFAFASDANLDTTVAVEQWLGAMRASAPLARAFDLLSALTVGAVCAAVHPVDDEWHDATVAAAVDLAANTVSLAFVGLPPPALTLPLSVVRTRVQLAAADDGADEFARLQCELCGSVGRRLTDHHLYPRSEHARLLKKGVPIALLTTTLARICRPCHSAVHRVEDNRTLAADWHTVAALKTHPRLQKWVAFWAHRSQVV